MVDILCKDQDGCQYIIEMQVAFYQGFQECAQYYASKAFISQMHKGGKYEHLKEVIFLAFTNFSIFPEKKHYKSEHLILDKETHENNLDKLSFTFVDLIKFDQQRNKDLDKLTLEEKFYYFLRHAPETKPEELKKLISKHQIIKRAFTELDHFYWTENQLRLYEREEKNERDFAAIMTTAEGKGIKKGIEKGKAEGIQIGEKKGLDFLVSQGYITKEAAQETIKKLQEEKNKS